MDKYTFVLFKLKGHRRWKIVNGHDYARDHEYKGKIEKRKEIEIDRETGEILITSIIVDN